MNWKKNWKKVLTVGYYSVIILIGIFLVQSARWFHYHNNTQFVKYNETEKISPDDPRMTNLKDENNNDWILPNYEYSRYATYVHKTKTGVFPFLVNEKEEIESGFTREKIE